MQNILKNHGSIIIDELIASVTCFRFIFTYLLLLLDKPVWHSGIPRRLSHHWHRLHKTCWLHWHRRLMSNVFLVSVATLLQEREIVSARN